MRLQALGLEALGDAFLLLDNSGKRVLVDAGEHLGEVADRLAEAGIKGISVAVCTHCDEDHVGGMPAVLQRIAVEELWLPGSWAEVLVGAVCEPAGVRELLSAKIEKDDESEIAGAAVDGWAERVGVVSERRGSPEMAARPAEEDLASVLLRGVATLDAGDDSEMDERLRVRLEDLKGIVRAALDAGTRVRFFSYEEAELQRESCWQTSGFPGRFTIVNAREVPVDLCPAEALVSSFALTVQNRRALVPFAFGPSSGRGALFCSDSSFEFLDYAPVPWDLTGLITAPHHGSGNRAHDELYSAARRSGFDGWWIRSHNDRTYKSWPGARWRALPEQKRLCTRCKGNHKGSIPPQDLTFVWTDLPVPDGSHRACSCR